MRASRYNRRILSEQKNHEIEHANIVGGSSDGFDIGIGPGGTND
jgi:hypothetical protein